MAIVRYGRADVSDLDSCMKLLSGVFMRRIGERRAGGNNYN